MATTRIPTSLKNAVSTQLDIDYPTWRTVGANTYGIDVFNQKLDNILANQCSAQWNTLTQGMSTKEISQLRQDLIEALEPTLKAAKGMGPDNFFHSDTGPMRDVPDTDILREEMRANQTEKPKTFLPTAPKATAHPDPKNVKDQHFTMDANYIWMGKDNGGWTPISSLSYEETNKAVVDINRKIKVYNQEDINCQRRDILEEHQKRFGNSNGCHIV